MYNLENVKAILGNENVTGFIAMVNDAIATMRISKVYIVGSYAKGNIHAFSDIDLIFISSNFERYSHITRRRIIQRMINECDARIDVLCYTPIEYQEIVSTCYFRNKCRIEVWNDAN